MVHGCIPTRPTPPEIVDVLVNPEAIAIDQAWSGFAGDFLRQAQPGVELWVKPLRDESVAVVLFARSVGAAVEVKLALSTITYVNASKAYSVRDIWNASSSVVRNELTVSLRTRQALLLRFDALPAFG